MTKFTDSEATFQAVVNNPYTGRQVNVLPLFKLLHSTDDRNDGTEGLTIVASKVIDAVASLTATINENFDLDTGRSIYALLEVAQAFMAMKHVEQT